MTNAMILAQIPGGIGTIIGTATFLVAVFFVGFLVLLARQYKRCPSNRVLVIFGRAGTEGQAAKTVHGGASFVVPLLQDYAFLSLEPIQIEIPLRGALSSENIRVNVPSVFTVAVGTEQEVMHQAAIRLLGLTVAEIRKQAEEIIFGILRQVIAGMGIEEINRDRDKFLDRIQSHLEPELNKIGLQLINVNITDITDESGYIDAIGQKAASEAIQKARGDVADNLKMGEIRVASADRDKAIQVAGAKKKKRLVPVRPSESRRFVSLNWSRNRRSAKRKLHSNKNHESGTPSDIMRINVADADATAIEGENLATAKIAHSKAELAVKQAEAYELGESRKKEAEAAVLVVKNLAMAKAAVADAQRVEAEQRAELEAPAKAKKARTIVEAEAEAERKRIDARGEADAIFAKLDAEARGQFEILAKKGEGLQCIVDACGGAKEAFQMLMLEHLDNLAEASSKAISNIKFDKIVVWENGGHNGRTNTADFISGLAKTLPPMMQVMKDIGGVEFSESLIKFSGDSTENNGAAAEPTTSANKKGGARSEKTSPVKNDSTESIE